MKTWHRVALSVGAVGAMLASTIALTPHQAGPSDIYPPADVIGVTNPDISQANIHETICNPQWHTSTIRPPTSYTSKLKFLDMQKYHLTGVTMEYELDHLISLELGGDPRSPANLWMEPYNPADSPDGGARNKDKVETYLHDQVCAGVLTLSEAQRQVVTDWYRVYKAMGATVGGVDQGDPDDE